MNETTFEPNWLPVSDVATLLSTTAEAVEKDILHGVYENPLRKNGAWFVKTDEVVTAFCALVSPQQSSTPQRPNARPSWARTDKWYDAAVPPYRRYHGTVYVAFSEAARRLGTTYQDIYYRAKREDIKSARHIRHHWYLTDREVRWFERQQQRGWRAA